MTGADQHDRRTRTEVAPASSIVAAWWPGSAGRWSSPTTRTGRSPTSVAISRPTLPMLRLIQGDVGSGKTAVAAYALAAAAKAGLQGALLAPTDLLARQHRDRSELLDDTGVGVCAPDRVAQHA